MMMIVNNEVVVNIGNAVNNNDGNDDDNNDNDENLIADQCICWENTYTITKAIKAFIYW